MSEAMRPAEEQRRSRSITRGSADSVLNSGVETPGAHAAPPAQDEHKYGGVKPPPRPRLTIFADTPLTNDQNDRLGFAAYADALAGLLDHPDTDTPLTIAISAEWGAGKTSLANMVARRLVDRPQERGDRSHIICRFDAWMNDDAPHLGSAFAAEVAKLSNRYRAWPRQLLSPLPSSMLTPEKRWRRRICLGLGCILIAVLFTVTLSPPAAVSPETTVAKSFRLVIEQ